LPVVPAVLSAIAPLSALLALVSTFKINNRRVRQIFDEQSCLFTDLGLSGCINHDGISRYWNEGKSLLASGFSIRKPGGQCRNGTPQVGTPCQRLTPNARSIYWSRGC
jgi:hypothetical protein